MDQPIILKIKVRNYGSANITSFTACYTAENMFIPVTEDVTLTTPLLPGDTTEYTFINGQYVFDYLPNPFKITAFTRLSPTDLYSDNDSISRYVVIGPLSKDVALKAILTPTDVVVANNDIPVSIHIKNLGIEPITSLPVSYKVTGQNLVTETIVSTHHSTTTKNICIISTQPIALLTAPLTLEFGQNSRATFTMIMIHCLEE